MTRYDYSGHDWFELISFVLIPLNRVSEIELVIVTPDPGYARLSTGKLTIGHEAG